MTTLDKVDASLAQPLQEPATFSVEELIQKEEKQITLHSIIQRFRPLLQQVISNSKLQFRFSFEPASVLQIQKLHPECKTTSITEVYMDTSDFKLANENMWLKYVWGPKPRWSLKVAKKNEENVVSKLECIVETNYDKIFEIIKSVVHGEEDNVEDMCSFMYARVEIVRMSFVGEGYEIYLDDAEFQEGMRCSVGCIRIGNNANKICDQIPKDIQEMLLIQKPTNSKIIQLISHRFPELLESLKNKGSI